MSTKISALPPSAGLVLTDIFPVVDDPGGVPVTQKATFTQLASLLGTGNFVLKSGDTMTGNLALPSVSFPDGGVITDDGAGNQSFTFPASLTIADSVLSSQLILTGDNTTPGPPGMTFLAKPLLAVGEHAFQITQTWSATGSVLDCVVVDVTDSGIANFASALLRLTHTDISLATADVFKVGATGISHFTGTVSVYGGPFAFASPNSGLQVFSGVFPGTLVHRLGDLDLGFFGVAAVGQQSAAGDTLVEVLAALRAYGLLS